MLSENPSHSEDSCHDNEYHQEAHIRYGNVAVSTAQRSKLNDPQSQLHPSQRLSSEWKL